MSNKPRADKGPHITLSRKWIAWAVAVASMCASSMLMAQWPDQHFTVDGAGNISPQQGFLHSGQKAVWTFATASPANALVRQTWIYPNYVAAPYDPTYLNEFMTPLPKGMSGIFVISENQGGLVEQTAPCVAPSEGKATRTTSRVICGLPPPCNSADTCRLLTMV